jgi:thioredoxin reductase
MSFSKLPVAVIGAGPVGLATAAHLLQRGLRPIIFESGPDVGHAVRQWQHVRVFSPWRYNIDRAARTLLEANGWQAPDPGHHPTGAEILRDYLAPLADVPAIRAALTLNARVIAVGKRGFDKVRTAGREDVPFVVTVLRDGVQTQIEARAVIDASGTYLTPNPAGAGGLPAIGEDEARDKIIYGIPDVLGDARARYAGKRVLVVGTGHSAMNALLDLCALQRAVPATEIHWALRRAAPDGVYGGGEADQLQARGELGQRTRAVVERGCVQIEPSFRIMSIDKRDDGLHVRGLLGATTSEVVVDEIIVATGTRPDLSFLRELRVALDPALECVNALASLIDPNIHSCGTVRPHGFEELKQPEKDFFILGMKSYGRAPTFLLATGYEQARSVVAALAGDLATARLVQLELPETGVCTSALPDSAGDCAVPALAGTAAACCGPSAPKPRIRVSARSCS